MSDLVKGLSLMEIAYQVESGTEIIDPETGEIFIVSKSPPCGIAVTKKLSAEEREADLADTVRFHKEFLKKTQTTDHT